MDKFNGHIHRKRNLCHVNKVTTFSYDSMFYLFGGTTDQNGYVLFFQNNFERDNPNENSITFKVPLNSVEIKQCRWFPSASKIFVNTKRYDTFNSLTGLKLQKDDEIRAIHQPNSNYMFSFEAVVTTHIN